MRESSGSRAGGALVKSERCMRASLRARVVAWGSGLGQRRCAEEEEDWRVRRRARARRARRARRRRTGRWRRERRRGIVVVTQKRGGSGKTQAWLKRSKKRETT
jgi:hypothetical protein